MAHSAEPILPEPRVNPVRTLLPGEPAVQKPSGNEAETNPVAGEKTSEKLNESSHVPPVEIKPMMSDDDAEPTRPVKREPFKGGQKRTEEEREADYVIVGEKRIRGWKDTEIAEFINNIRPYRITARQVGEDHKVVDRRYMESRIGPTNRMKFREVHYLEALEREAFEGWERSKGESYSQTQTAFISGKEKSDRVKNGNGGIIATRRGKRDGDPKFLDVIIRLHERRCKLLGLDAPVKIDVEVSGEVVHGVNIAQMRLAYRERLLAEMGIAPPVLPEAVKQLQSPDEATADAPPEEENPLPGE